MTEDLGAAPPDPALDPASRTLEVTVLRSGGVAGMVRRWSARIPDDGAPAARAARRIAGLADSRVSDGRVSDGRTGKSPLRDAFQWTVTSGEGSLRCDQADRSRDPDLDHLIRVVAEGHLRDSE
jgi:ketosteroid isomerase-like protein